MKKRLLLVMLLVLAMTLGLHLNAYAATSQTVTITAVPSYITIGAIANNTWTLNGLTGTSVVAVDTIYYANPLGDTTIPSDPVVNGECYFTVDSTGSSVAIDIRVDCENFSTALMDNSEIGDNSATEYGGYSYTADGAFDYSTDKVIMKLTATGSDVLIDELAVDTAQKFGAAIETPTNAWTTGDSETATMTIVASAD